MNAFVEAIADQETRTTNGMVTRVSSSSALVDLFYQIGASRGKDIIPAFTAAFVQDQDLALRIALWTRDVRGGAGERQLFRDILKHLEYANPGAAVRLLQKTAEVGRYDDLFVFETKTLQDVADAIWHDAIFVKKSALAAKWTPRKGPVALRLRTKYGLSPKQYRKTLVGLTQVVETQMCAGDWDNINYSHVPSQASRIYRNAFKRHSAKYAEYVMNLASGAPDVKVNAGAIFPHDVIRSVLMSDGFNQPMGDIERKHIIAQWDALPNYLTSANIMPLVDVSGSMNSGVAGSSVRCLDVAVGLGLYLSDKNTGPFNGTFLTFSDESELIKLQGDIVQKAEQMSRSEWQMSTNLHSAFDKILDVAVNACVPESDMPKVLLILSDMQFNECVKYDDSAMQMIRRKYHEAGYAVPQVVFWNLNAHGGSPVKANEDGVALVSGFSPSIMTSILSAKVDKFTPEYIMMSTIMQDRYSC